MATRPSKFQGIFQPDEEPVIEAVATPSIVPVPPLVELAPSPEPQSVVTAAPTENLPEQGSISGQRTGRPATGKKSDPNYRQVTAYVRKELYRDVTDTLYDESRGLDTKRKEFSELVDELLEQWWQDRQKHIR